MWLISDAADGGKLKIVSSINQVTLPPLRCTRGRSSVLHVCAPLLLLLLQESPAFDPSKKPLLVIDLWEHVRARGWGEVGEGSIDLRRPAGVLGGWVPLLRAPCATH